MDSYKVDFSGTSNLHGQNHYGGGLTFGDSHDSVRVGMDNDHNTKVTYTHSFENHPTATHPEVTNMPEYTNIKGPWLTADKTGCIHPVGMPQMCPSYNTDY